MLNLGERQPLFHRYDESAGRDCIPRKRTIEMARGHPDVDDWQRLLWRQCAPEKAADMARHLDECRECMSAFLAAPAPPPTALGRPLPLGAIWHPDFAEREATGVHGCVLETLDRGGTLAVSAAEEASLYVVLEAVLGRLRRDGVAVRISGTPKAVPFVELSGDAGVQLVFPGPLAPAPGLMPPPSVGNVCIVARISDEWRSLGVEPDIDCPSILDSAVHVADSAELLHKGSFKERLALLLSAIDCDIPQCLVEGAVAPKWLAPVLDARTGTRTAWLAVRGAWGIRGAVLDWHRQNQDISVGMLRVLDEDRGLRCEALTPWRSRLRHAAKRVLRFSCAVL